MKKISLLLSIFMSVIYGYSQPSISWQKSLGGYGFEFVASIQQTIDGGYIVAGSTPSINNGDVTGSHGGYDYWIVKLTNIGIIEWQKCLGGKQDDRASSIQQTTDGGYIVAGFSNSNDGDVSGNHGNSDWWIVKLTSTGIIEWQKCLGGTGGETAKSIRQTSDGGYIIAGEIGSGYWIVKVINTGIIQWQKSLGGSGIEEVSSVQQTFDGGYIIAGRSSSYDGDVTGNHGDYDYWIVKLTNTGIIEWQKCLGGTQDEFAKSIQQTTDGGYIIAGSSNSKDGDVIGQHQGNSYCGYCPADYWIVKLTNTGIIEWQKCLGGTGNDYPHSIQQTTDGGYVIAGASTSNDYDVTGNHGNSDCWIVKLTSTGIIQWQKSFGGIGVDGATSIQQTSDGGYVIAGPSTSKDGDVTGNHGDYDYWVVKLNNILNTDESSIENLFSVYPNPVNNKIHVNAMENALGSPFTIYDELGRAIITGKLNEYHSIIETDHLSKGVYILSIGDKIKTTRKIIKE